MNLKKFLTRTTRTPNERRIYEAIVAQARQPWFYADLGVPDTVEGRFDLIVLHSFLTFDRLSGEGEAAEDFSQKIFDEMFMDMDRSLREMGVGDLSVGKRIRKMAEVFYGRAEAYKHALEEHAADGGAALKGALSRNIYEGNIPDGTLDIMANYIFEARSCLSGQQTGQMLAGEVRFPQTEQHSDATPNADT